VTPAPQFEVHVNGDGVCIVRGELDEYTGGELASALAAHPAVTGLDLGEVSFVDSAGLRALLVIRRQREEAGTGLHVCRSSTVVRRVLRLAGIAHLFTYQPGSAAAG
jgi:anti-sigma B factor antagonist